MIFNAQKGWSLFLDQPFLFVVLWPMSDNKIYQESRRL